MCELSNDPCLVSSPVARVVFTNKRMEAYQVEGDVGEGISRILQDYIENEERQS